MKIGRNNPCYCGSGKKYKNCCLIKENKNLSNSIDNFNYLYNYGIKDKEHI